jgi:arylsulfatase A-like enzyme
VTGDLTRRDFIGAALGTTAAISALGASDANAQEARDGARATPAPSGVPGRARPNVLFILADDLGYGDLSCYGRPDYKTPVLDRFASEGLKFTSNYAAAPVCTPTRCAFITGRYPQRLPVGLEEPLTRNSPEVGLPDGHPTIATQLRAAGYDTALIGKWHLGWKAEFNPVRHGFDEFFGVLSGAVDYFTHAAADATRTEGGKPSPDLWENETRVERSGYLTDVLTDRAIDYIARKRGRPFFLSLQYNAPHSPWEGPGDAGVDHDDHGPGPMAAGGSLATYGAMMRSLDANIGRVLAALKRAGLERDTLVVFTSDNGGERYSYNWPFSGEKFDLREGGTRVPAIARWPGVVPASSTSEQPIITMDWTATFIAVAGAAPAPSYPLDGESLLPTLRGERAVHDRAFFWRTRNRGAARIGNWKYLQNADGEHLFDVGVDFGEKAELKTKRADVFATVKSRYDAWAAEMLPRRT